MEEGGFLYLLESFCKRHRYLGSTPHPEQRLSEHNNGSTKATRDKGPWFLLGIWKLPTLREARQIEFQIKKQKKKLSIEYISYVVNKQKEGEST